MPLPNARFIELLADIEPSATTRSRASGGHTGVRDHLKNQAKFKDRYVSSFLSGSYARDTSIRPHTTEDGQERPDVDTIVVTSHEASDHPDAVLKELCRALEDSGNGYAVERINKRSARGDLAGQDGCRSGGRHMERVHDPGSRERHLEVYQSASPHQMEWRSKHDLRRPVQAIGEAFQVVATRELERSAS